MHLADLSAARLLIVGDVMLDRYWFGEVARISPEAPVPVVKVGRSEERPGGAANVARNVAALGARVALLSVVGEDEAGRSLQRLLTASGIDVSLHLDPAISTTVKLRVIGRQQQLLRIDFETAPSHEVLRAKLFEFEGASWSLTPLDSAGLKGVVFQKGSNKVLLPFPDSTKSDWHHIAVTQDSSQFRLYRDGILTGIVMGAAGSGDTKKINLNGEGSRWYGRLDELRIYHRRLDELDFGEVDTTGDGGGGERLRRGGQRQVAFAGEQAAGGVQAHPPGAGQENLHPGVQIGEVFDGADGAVERLHVGLELDEVA